MTMENKVVAITGAGSGIGRATALLLAARGARIVLAGRREERIAEVAVEIEAAGGRAVYQVVDVTLRDDLQALVGFACKTFDRLDVLISNAGIGPISRFSALRVDDWDAMIDVNIRGVLHGIAAALPLFQVQQRGHFIVVTSTAGLLIKPEMGVYGATKNALRTIVEALRQEAALGLRVTEISPGMVATDFALSIGDKSARARIQESLDAVAISPHAIAQAIAFAIEQPDEVEVGSIVIRPTAQK